MSSQKEQFICDYLEIKRQNLIMFTNHLSQALDKNNTDLVEMCFDMIANGDMWDYIPPGNHSLDSEQLCFAECMLRIIDTEAMQLFSNSSRHLTCLFNAAYTTRDLNKINQVLTIISRSDMAHAATLGRLAVIKMCWASCEISFLQAFLHDHGSLMRVHMEDRDFVFLQSPFFLQYHHI